MGEARPQPGGRRPLARHRKPPSRRMRRAASATAIVLAGGGAAVGLLYATGPQPALTGAANQGHAVAAARVGKTDGAATALATPAGAGAPAQAYVPRHAAGRARRAADPAAATGTAATGGASLSPNTRAGAGGSPAASASAPSTASSSGASSSASPAPSGAHATSSPPPSGAVTPPSSAPPSSAPPSGASGACADPTFTTSSAFGSETVGAYTISNNMFNAGGGGISQTLSACSSGDWSVSANIAADGGGVKTYPNSAYDFAAPPEISSLGSVASTFGSTLPASGEFDDAYDIWLNGTAGTGGDEVMIWTASQGQTPAGAQIATATIDGQDYAVWQQSGGPITFVSTSDVTAGDLNLLPFFQWLTGNGYEPSSSTLNQVAFGAQIVSTDATQETFGFNNFSVTAS
jgi:hypothetical protein